MSIHQAPNFPNHALFRQPLNFSITPPKRRGTKAGRITPRKYSSWKTIRRRNASRFMDSLRRTDWYFRRPNGNSGCKLLPLGTFRLHYWLFARYSKRAIWKGGISLVRYLLSCRLGGNWMLLWKVDYWSIIGSNRVKVRTDLVFPPAIGQ